MSAKTVAEIVGAIKNFASDNKLKIHPGRNLQKWATLVVKENYHCPCKPQRAGCPCAEALKDIKEQNCCLCRLFVNDAYLSEYYSLLAQRRRGV